MLKRVLKSLCTAVGTGMAAAALSAAAAQPERVYTFDVPDTPLSAAKSPVKVGPNRAPDGSTLDFNVSYFLKDGKPWLPVMGELHFSRIPEAEWDEALVKMKRAGIDIVATYVFWNHHEEIQGAWDFSGCRNLRKFAEKCAAHGLFLWARIGPWCHGEALWGGFPEYVQKAPKRNNNPLYLDNVKRLYERIGAQLNGLFFKDGGPVIGIQLENEYDFASDAGYAHMKTLQKLAKDAKMDPPFWSATMWPAAHEKSVEFLLGLGGYPESPWAQHLNPKPPVEVFCYRRIKVDPDVGADILDVSENTQTKISSLMPLMTVELGGGNQVTWHRRPRINELDCISMAIAATGSGANGIGYYMFCGGVNPPGKTGPLQESRTSGYPNDCPLVNYDFQAPIGSELQLNAPFKHYSLFHSFLNRFGETLAPLPAIFPDKRAQIQDTALLRCGLRGTDKGGFIFFSNYHRYVDVDTQRKVQFRLEFSDGESLNIPSVPYTFGQGAYGIWPYRMDCGGIELTYATATPIKKMSLQNQECFVFITDGSALFEFEPGTAVYSSFSGVRADSIMTPRESAQFHIRKGDKTVHFITFNRRDLFRELPVHKDALPFTEVAALSPCDTAFAIPKGPRYGVDFKVIPGAKVYRIDLSSLTRQDTEKTLLDFQYLGDTAGLYQDSRLIQDDFWYGQPMRLRMSRIPDLNRPLYLQVTPISKDWPVFFNDKEKAKLPQTPSAVLQKLEIHDL